MKNQLKAQFPLTAALLATKALKEIAGDSRDSSPLFVIRGHETMSVTLDLPASGPSGTYFLFCEGEELARYEDEIGALIGLTHYTFESTRDYAAGWLAAQSPALRVAIRGA